MEWDSLNSRQKDAINKAFRLLPKLEDDIRNARYFCGDCTAYGQAEDKLLSALGSIILIREALEGMHLKDIIPRKPEKPDA